MSETVPNYARRQVWLVVFIFGGMLGIDMLRTGGVVSGLKSFGAYIASLVIIVITLCIGWAIIKSVGRFFFGVFK